MRSVQAPGAVVMIRPHHFAPNPQTAVDNAFQRTDLERSPGQIARAAYEEVTAMAAALEGAGVTVHLFDDETTASPDSVFPNNWFSTHAGGHVALYPMFAESRRRERRSDVIEMLKRRYRVQDVIDYSGLEMDRVYLEGTGAMVLDHIDRTAYAVKSNRTDPVALERFCTHFNYEPIAFDASDGAGQPVYHTNVLMCIGTGFALIALDMIDDATRRSDIEQRLLASGRDVIGLSRAQIADFAGNAIELQGRDGRILALSSRACRSLTADQIDWIEASASLLPIAVPTIELAGGSVRCMVAGVHLARR